VASITYNNIAGVYRKQEKYKEALDYYKKALKIRKENLGDGHYRVALSHVNIGLIYLNQDKHQKALDELDKALKIQEKIFTKNHSFTRKTQKNIDYIKKEMKSKE
jgi:tetratricopeptide (TPR) repeat protein